MRPEKEKEADNRTEYPGERKQGVEESDRDDPYPSRKTKLPLGSCHSLCHYQGSKHNCRPIKKGERGESNLELGAERGNWEREKVKQKQTLG